MRGDGCPDQKFAFSQSKSDGKLKVRRQSVSKKKKQHLKFYTFKNRANWCIMCKGYVSTINSVFIITILIFQQSIFIMITNGKKVGHNRPEEAT